jgi:hypothetical protein
MADRTVRVSLSAYEWFDVRFDIKDNPDQIVRSQIEWEPGQRFRLTATLRQAITTARKQLKEDGNG